MRENERQGERARGTYVLRIYLLFTPYTPLVLVVRVQARGKSKSKKKGVGKGGAAAASGSTEAPEQTEVLQYHITHILYASSAHLRSPLCTSYAHLATRILYASEIGCA